MKNGMMMRPIVRPPKENQSLAEMVTDHSNQNMVMVKCWKTILRIALQTSLRFGWAVWVFLLTGFLLPYLLGRNEPVFPVAILAPLISALVLIRQRRKAELYQAEGEYCALLLAGIPPWMIKLLSPLRLIGMVLICELAAASLAAITGAFSAKMMGTTLCLSALLVLWGLLPVKEKTKTKNCNTKTEGFL